LCEGTRGGWLVHTHTQLTYALDDVCRLMFEDEKRTCGAAACMFFLFTLLYTIVLNMQVRRNWPTRPAPVSTAAQLLARHV